MKRSCRLAVVVTAVLAACGGLAPADTLTITTSKDNTLIETVDGSLSHGASYSFYSGRVGSDGEGTKRRGVIQFDFSAIPSGSTITSVSLQLYCSGAGLTTAYPIALKRMSAAWGEGASFAFGGGGASSEPGDATWLHRYYPGTLWTTPGGDFVSTISATRNVGPTGWYTWVSTAQLVADVQGWVNTPASNFGWLVQGNETTLKSVKKFDAKEIPGGATSPKLTIVYTPPVQVVGDLTGEGKVNGADLAYLLGKWGSAGPGDFDGNGIVDAGDLSILLGAWTG